MRPAVIGLLAAIRAHDLKAIYAVHERFETEHGVENGAHAAAMLIYDEMRRERNQARAMLARANEESAKFAQAFMDAKRHLAEQKDINATQAERIRHLRERLEPNRVAA